MQLQDILETMMMICFGFAWPMNILKTLQTRSTKGKSLFFLVIVVIGYIFGITAKIIAQKINYVLFFYSLNFVMVLTDLTLYIKYSRAEKGLIK